MLSGTPRTFSISTTIRTRPIESKFGISSKRVESVIAKFSSKSRAFRRISTTTSSAISLSALPFYGLPRSRLPSRRQHRPTAYPGPGFHQLGQHVRLQVRKQESHPPPFETYHRPAHHQSPLHFKFLHR